MIDLFSDTTTRPTPEMRKAIAEAEVGDEQRGLDPSVNRLQDKVAALLGKEAALFLPTGTMCNAISFLVHCRPGDEILMHSTAHPLNHEGGGPSALGGAVITPLSGDRGMFTADDVRNAIRPNDRYSPKTKVVSIEQTSNAGGGACWPTSLIRDVCAAADESGLIKHMDGARLFNAVVATGTPADEFAAPFDSVWIDLSKGLGAPIGGVLAGSSTFIAEAWRHKQRMGGAMRQAGIVAAAGIYALDHHIDRLAEDHDNARYLAEGLAGIPGIDVDPSTIETNIVFFDVGGTGYTGTEFAAHMDERGVAFSDITGNHVRAVTHLDVDRAGIEKALGEIRTFLV